MIMNNKFWVILSFIMASVFGVVFPSYANNSESPTSPSKVQDEALLASRYINKKLRVVDVSEIQVDGVSTLSITFSVPLKAKQKFADKLHLVDSKSGKVDGAWVLSKNQQELRLSHLEPKRNLIITIDKTIEAVNKEFLPEEVVASIKTKDLQPILGFSSRGSLFPVRLAEGLPIFVLNVPQVTVEFFRIKDTMLPQFLTMWSKDTNLQYWQAGDLLSMADLVYTGGFKLNVAKNTKETVLLPISGIKPLQKTGVYLAVLRQSGTYKYSNPATVFTISDIGLSVHRYKSSDALVVLAQSLETGKPLSGIDILAFDKNSKVIGEIKTNAKGYAELVNMQQADLVLARHNGQTTMLHLKSAALDLSEFTVTGLEDAPLQFFIFGPRDLYRPGETVLLNALLRDKDGLPVTDMPVIVEVRSGDGAIVRNFVWEATQPGFYQYKLKINNDAKTGTWSFLVKIGGKTVNQYYFHIEDFLPERLALELKANKQPLARDDKLQIPVSGRYLYGAPASGNLVSGQIYIEPLREAVAKLSGYQFGDVKKTTLPNSIDFSQFRLDQAGKGIISIKNQWDYIRTPIKLIVQASLQETGGRSIVRRVVQPVWPASQLVGIRPLFEKNEIEEGSNAEFEIVLANNKGDKLAAKNLVVNFIHERRDYYWSYSQSNGWESDFTEKDVIMDEQSIKIDKNSTTKVSFPVDWGYYRIEVINPDTNLITSFQFRAGYWWQENTQESGRVRPDQVKIVLDKANYNVNDKAKITITPPAAGAGYLMIESSDGPLWWQPVEIPATGKTFEIPVTKEWQRHDIYISALVIRPGERKVGATPKRAVGVLHLPLDRQARKIALELTAPDKILPSQKLKIKIKANDVVGKNLKQINVLVAAVDVGILNITGYNTPNPFEYFFGRKAYGVDQLDVYGQLIEAGQGRLARMAFGGDAALAVGGKKPDNSPTIVALQSKPLQLNDQGEGEVQLAIPDFNGQLSIMAQAWTTDSFGMAEAKTVVAAPVIVELATPRFLAGGDKTALALDMSNLSSKNQQLKVTVDTEGLLSLVDKQTDYNVNLAKGERKTVTIPVKALEGMGHGKISVSVVGILSDDGQTIESHRSWTIGIRPAYPAKSETFQSVLEKSLWNIPTAAMNSLSREGREGLIQLTTQPPLNLAKQISSLNAYPYGCAEQTTSQLYPSLYANAELLKHLKIDTNQTDQQRRNAVDIGIGRLLGMQRDNGSFGLWGNDSEEEDWLTVYVTDFLQRARERGYSVPDVSLEKASKRLLKYLQNDSEIDSTYSENINQTRFAVQAYAGYILAKSKQAPLDVLRSLYNKRDDAPSGLSLVQLATALKLMGDNTRAEQLLKEGLVKQRDSHNWWIGDYGSVLRDEALILELLQEYHLVADDQIYQRLFTLSQQVANEQWLSTQESNSLFLAGYRLLSVSEQDWQAEIEIAGNKHTLSNKQPIYKFSEQEMKEITTLKVANKSPDIKLFQTVNLTGYPKLAPKATTHDTLTISKEYLDLSGKPINLAGVKSGDLIIVRLHLHTQQRLSDALVVDLLPAGLELENQNLAQSSASLKDAAATIKKSLDSMQNARIAHQEFRDDRYIVQLDLGFINSNQEMDLIYLVRAVTPGEYLVPPAMVESMYRPNWQATSNAPSLLVVSPR